MFMCVGVGGSACGQSNEIRSIKMVRVAGVYGSNMGTVMAAAREGSRPILAILDQLDRRVASDGELASQTRVGSRVALQMVVGWR